MTHFPTLIEKIIVYDHLVRIRVFMDENPSKAKQMVTNLINDLKEQLSKYNQ